MSNLGCVRHRKMCGMGWKKEHFQWNEILLGAASSSSEKEKLLTQVQHKQHDKTMVKIEALKVSIQQGQKRENKS